MLQALFQTRIPQGQFAHQTLQLLHSVSESPFLGRLVVEFATALLSLPMVKQARGNVMPSTELGRAALPTHQLFHYLTLELYAEISLIPLDYTLTLPDLPNPPNPKRPVSGVHSTPRLPRRILSCCTVSPYLLWVTPILTQQYPFR